MTGQVTLFESPAATPAGLRYVPDFITADAERSLIANIRTLPLARFQFGAYQGNRRVASFGFRYDYMEKRLLEAEIAPSWLTPIIGQVEKFGGPATHICQILCTEYDAGVGIGWHRDKPQFDKIFGLSLGSRCKFRFRRKDGEKWERYTLGAGPRSLYVMEGDARQVWEQSIPGVEDRRYSITFRTMASRA